MKATPPTPQAVDAFLSAVMGGAITELTPIDYGEWSTVYSFRTRGQAFVVRFSDYYEDFAKDRLAYAYQSPRLPVPRIIELGEAFGGYFAISQKMPGVAIDLLDAEHSRQVIPALFDLLDALRLADVSATEGYGGWSAEGRGAFASWREALLDVGSDTAAKRTHGWRERLAAWGGLPQFSRLQQKMASLLEYCPERRHLIHGDLLHYNLLVEGEQVSGVLDWGCSLYGDFLYELAWFTFWAPWHPSLAGIDFRERALHHYAQIGLEAPHFAERLACYELHIALDSIAYCSYTGNWAQVEQVVAQAMGVAEGL